MAIYQCSWRWHPGAAARSPQERDQAFRTVFHAAETGEAIGASRLLGWYSYPGRAAGFLLLEAGSHEELAKMLRPYTELMEFDVEPVIQVDYEQARQRLGVAASAR